MASLDAPQTNAGWRVRPLQAEDHDRWRELYAGYAAFSGRRFRDRSEVERDLHANGYEVVDVRSASDRPGQELVFLARRRGRAEQRAGSALA
jgi:hypothetical protein